MARAPGGPFARAWLVCLALAVGACSGGGSATRSPGGGGPGGRGGQPRGSDSAPVKDTFTGAVTSGTGAYSGHRQGGVMIHLHPRGSGESRPVRVVFHSRCGGSPTGCVNLDGTVQGTLTGSRRRVPDVGRDYSLSATGRIGSLGRVVIRGGVVGTGFISNGHELLKLTLTTTSGRVTIVAYSGVVRGFTSP